MKPRGLWLIVLAPLVMFLARFQHPPAVKTHSLWPILDPVYASTGCYRIIFPASRVRPSPSPQKCCVPSKQGFPAPLDGLHESNVVRWMLRVRRNAVQFAKYVRIECSCLRGRASWLSGARPGECSHILVCSAMLPGWLQYRHSEPNTQFSGAGILYGTHARIALE